jgi:hypothetical protein
VADVILGFCARLPGRPQALYAGQAEILLKARIISATTDWSHALQTDLIARAQAELEISHLESSGARNAE